MSDVYLEHDEPAAPQADEPAPPQAEPASGTSAWPAVERCDWVFSRAPPAVSVATYGRVTPASRTATRRRM